ncbi:hypothetical protein NDU88_007913 [Pleurodeles waltl]|uniref:Uncharacterized protein n=1 Tax=Pleurodeles waltl TaxID=8319 RepID=A0AAV7P261_PLEWA|nr:hypothetical protein NDU88_007913 [Pleurodeles waltl]
MSNSGLLVLASSNAKTAGPCFQDETEEVRPTMLPLFPQKWKLTTKRRPRITLQAASDHRPELPEAISCSRSWTCDLQSSSDAISTPWRADRMPPPIRFLGAGNRLLTRPPCSSRSQRYMRKMLINYNKITFKI